MSPVLFQFNTDDVLFDLQEKRLELPDSYRLQVDRYWQNINRDERFFNGNVLTATRLDLNGSPPTIQLAMTDYAHYLYAAQDCTREFNCNAVYCAAILLTSDQYLLLGRMASHTSSPGQIQCPGGGIEIGRGLKIDTRACCQREIVEEVGDAVWLDHQWFRPLCIKTEGDLATIGVIYALQLKSGVKDVLRMFSRHQAEIESSGDKPEFDSLLAVRFSVPSMKVFFEQQQARLVDYLRPLFIDRFEEVRSTMCASQTL